MRLPKVFKWASMLLMIAIMFAGTNPAAFAETDQNKSVFDCVENSKDCDEQLDQLNSPEEPAADSSQEEKAVGYSLGDFVRTFLAFLFVIGLLFVLLKFINRKNRMFSQHRFMKNVGGLSLGQQKSVQLVMIGDKYYLIGVGEDVRLLKEITDEKEIENLEAYFQDDEMKAPPTVLTTLFKKVTGQKEEPQEDKGSDTDFNQLFTTRIDEMREERKRQLKRLEEKERRKDE